MATVARTDGMSVKNQLKRFNPLTECELVKDVPARANTALIFLNSVGTHSASIPSDAPADIERDVYQVHFGVDEEMKRRLLGGLTGKAHESWAMARVEE